MKTTRFFFKFSHAYVQKNKLYQAFSDYMKSLDGTLIDGIESRNRFLDTMIIKKVALEKEHPRCKPIELHFFSVDETGIYVSGSFFSNLFVVEQYFSL